MTQLHELLTIYAGPFFILLGLLIFVHELGHYLVAVYFGVRVETFSLGFGKKIFKYQRGETTYCVSLIPLGGYVKMYGDDPSAQIPEAQKKYSFLHQPVWPRIAIVLAGPLMNLFFAVLVYAVVALIGEPVPGTRLGDIAPNTAAYTAGFRSGDKILAINEQKVNQWKEVKQLVDNSAETELTFEVLHEDETKPAVVKATPHTGKNDFIFTTQRQVGKIEGLTLESVSTMIGVPSPKSLAATAGFKTFDFIESINGETLLHWRGLEPALEKGAAKGSWIFLVKSYTGKDIDDAAREIKVAVPKKVNGSWLATLGIERSDLFLLNVKPKSPAALAGLKSTDKVISIEGKPLSQWQEVLESVKSYNPEKATLQLVVLQNGEQKTYNIKPELIDLPTEQGGMESRYAIGVAPALMIAPPDSFKLKTSNPLKALATGCKKSWEGTKMIAISFVRLAQAEVSPRNIGGVISIGRIAGKTFEAGMSTFLNMMAIISINLFLLNLLPIPVLDGGHLLFFTLEALKGAPISFKKLEIAQQFGLVLLLSLMLFALFNDISHLFSSW